MTDIDDLLTGGAAGKSMKFDVKGKSYSGTVVSSEARQATDLQTGEGKVWKDGSPAMQAVIGIQTDERDPSVENDDGVRYDYVKMWGEQKKAFRAAAQLAGGSPKPGDFYSVTFVSEKPSETRGFNPTKLYKYEIRKVNPIDAALDAGFPQTAPAAAYEAPVAPVQQVQQVQQAAPVQVATLTPQQEEMIKTLISKSLQDDQIAAIVDGATPQAIAGLRVQAGALAGAGF